jgi:hypothetical protein
MRLGPTEKAKVVFHDGFSVLSWEAAMWRREEAEEERLGRLLLLVGALCCWSMRCC